MADFTHTRISVVGAGMGGSMIALYLGTRGFLVNLYERRGDGRVSMPERGRSINMTLAARGLNALQEVGLKDSVMPLTVPLRGRMMHSVQGRLSFQPYGKNASEVIYAIQRNQLNLVLTRAAEKLPNVRLFFNKRCTLIDKSTGAICFEDELTGHVIRSHSDVVVGADGTFSCVRHEMQRGERANLNQQVLDGGYKELTIPAGPDCSHRMEPHALHVWPRGDSLLFAIPNTDGSFMANITLPFEGETSFSRLKTEAQILEFMKARFPDAVSLMPNLVQEFMSNAPARFVTVTTQPWDYKDRIVLLGDACHSVVPFYGQGMNAAFEDCKVLNECIDHKSGDWEVIFREYEARRKTHTDALAALSLQNYVELRERVASPWFVARKRLDNALGRMFPRVFVPLYTLITHTCMPYQDAVNQHARQKRWMKWTSLDILLSTAAAVTVCFDLTVRVMRSTAAVMTRWYERIAEGRRRSDKILAHRQSSE